MKDKTIGVRVSEEMLEKLELVLESEVAKARAGWLASDPRLSDVVRTLLAEALAARFGRGSSTEEDGDE